MSQRHGRPGERPGRGQKRRISGREMSVAGFIGMIDGPVTVAFSKRSGQDCVACAVEPRRFATGPPDENRHRGDYRDQNRGNRLGFSKRSILGRGAEAVGVQAGGFASTLGSCRGFRRPPLRSWQRRGSSPRIETRSPTDSSIRKREYQPCEGRIGRARKEQREAAVTARDFDAQGWMPQETAATASTGARFRFRPRIGRE